MATNPIPIPQGATIGEAETVAIPQGATIGTPEPERKGFWAHLGGDLYDTAKGIKGLFDEPKTPEEHALHTADPMGAALPLYRILHGYYEGTKKTIGQAEAAADKGDNAGVIINSAAAGLPVVGPLVSGVYEHAQAHPDDKLGSVGVGVSRIGQALSMAPKGSVLPNPVEGVAAVVNRGIKVAQPAMRAVAERAYSSALKPSTALEPGERGAVINTGLENAIPVSEKGFNTIYENIKDLNAKVDATIKSKPGATIAPNKVASRLNDTVDTFRNQVAPSADLKVIETVGNDFLDTHGGKPISAVDAQSLKKGTYKQIGSRAYGEVKGAQIEAEKSLARGLKEELEVQFPEIKGLNAQEAKFYGLEPILARAIGRISNHEIFGVGTPVVTGAAAVATGSAKMAAVFGTLKAVIDNPAVKSRLAIMLNKASKGSVSMKAAHGRIAAYSSAIARAAEQQDQTQEE